MNCRVMNQLFKYILIVLLLTGTAHVSEAQQAVFERVYVQTDKQVYLTGESLWTKIYVTQSDGSKSLLSKIVYLELIGDTIPYVQQKIDVSEGQASSRILLPVDLPTGNYRLVAYTRVMQNEGESVFFNRPITIYNPFTTERLINGQTSISNNPVTNELLSTPPATSLVSVDKPSFQSREQGFVYLKGVNEKVHSLSLSIYRKEELPGLPPFTIYDWKETIPSRQDTYQVTFLPEYEGHIVSGRIVADDGSAVVPESNTIVPLIAFPGEGMRLFVGRVEEEGQVEFFTKRIDGMEEAVTSVISVLDKTFRVDIQSPFAVHQQAYELPPLIVSDTLKDVLLERSIGVQAMHGFWGDTIWPTKQNLPHLLGERDKLYKLDEYTRFTSMQEVITEYVLGLRFRKVNGRRYLSSLTEDNLGFTAANTLVLLDGIPLHDHESIYTYDPLLVEQLEIFRGKYIFGGQFFDGIASFQTYDKNYKGVKFDPSSQLFAYKGTELQTSFYMPDYTNPKVRYSRLPDMRHTLLWVPEIKTKGDETITIPFFTSDMKGEYIVVVEGMSSDGDVIRSTTGFLVK